MKTRESSKEFFKTLILEDLEETLKKLRVKLTHGINDAMSLNESMAQEVLKYHEEGEDRDSLPNLHGIYFQP